jgi:hypothetical protein
MKFMRNIALIAITLILLGCGLVRSYQVERMSAEELASLDDETICSDAHREAGLAGRVPVNIMRELQKRNIEYCAFPNYTGGPR